MSLLGSEKKQLLYYHFCSSTLPGCKPVTFSVEKLLELWPKSNAARTYYGRRREIIGLLEELVQSQGVIADLDFKLVKEDDKIVGIIVRRKQFH